MSITPIHQLQRTPWRIVSAAASWHVTSQQQARRNALVASTVLTERRRELQDVEEFLAAHAARSTEALPNQRGASRTA